MSCKVGEYRCSKCILIDLSRKVDVLHKKNYVRYYFHGNYLENIESKLSYSIPNEAKTLRYVYFTLNLANLYTIIYDMEQNYIAIYQTYFNLQYS